jgi:uncharacterized protein with FMN-binding domain
LKRIYSAQATGKSKTQKTKVRSKSADLSKSQMTDKKHKSTQKEKQEINIEHEIKDSKMKALKYLENFFEEHVTRLSNLIRLRNGLQLN